MMAVKVYHNGVYGSCGKVIGKILVLYRSSTVGELQYPA